MPGSQSFCWAAANESELDWLDWLQMDKMCCALITVRWVAAYRWASCLDVLPWFGEVHANGYSAKEAICLLKQQCTIRHLLPTWFVDFILHDVYRKGGQHDVAPLSCILEHCLVEYKECDTTLTYLNWCARYTFKPQFLNNRSWWYLLLQEGSLNARTRVGQRFEAVT